MECEQIRSEGEAHDHTCNCLQRGNDNDSEALGRKAAQAAGGWAELSRTGSSDADTVHKDWGEGKVGQVFCD